MKDEDKIRERVELLLDNRQIFLMFVASAVIVALVFSLGVVVGKRMNTEPPAAPPTDPLALLDRMAKGGPGEEELTFHRALSEGVEQVRMGAPIAKQPAAVAAPTAAPAAPAKVPAKVADKPAKPAVADKVKAAAVAPVKPAKAKDKDAQPGQFTLQLSAFQERHEAEQFMLKLKQEGLKPYLVTSTIPSRGVWFRVRLGDYPTWEDALTAKQKFEQDHADIIAYVARR